MPTSPAPPIRVLLVDDHAVIRTGLRLLIESRPGLQVIGEAANRLDALAVAAREHPDLILLDLDLGGSSGLDFLPELLVMAPAARVLILTGLHDAELHRRAVRLGAMGVVVKDKAAKVLFQAIEKVHAGEVWLEGAVVAQVLGELTSGRTSPHQYPEAAKITRLTARERELVALVCEGLSNRQIARRLFRSEGTIRNSLSVIFEKLEVTDRLGLVLYASRHNLAKPRQ
jgi:two-component system, NarL family, nitrate/nitrite response regulator NarL